MSASTATNGRRTTDAGVGNASNEEGLVARYGLLAATAVCGLALASGWLLGQLGGIGHSTQLGLYSSPIWRAASMRRRRRWRGSGVERSTLTC